MRSRRLALVAAVVSTTCYTETGGGGSGGTVGSSESQASAEDTTSQGCDAGQAGCACYPNGTCNSPLVCDGSTTLCVPAGCTSATEGCPCIEDQCLPGLACDGALCRPGAADTGVNPGADSGTSGDVDDGLVLHLPLDDDFAALSGATDVGPSALHLSCNASECPSKVPGRIGDAAGFGGAHFLTVAGGGSLDLQGAFTIALWVRDTAETSDTRVFINRLVGNGHLASYEIEFFDGQLFAAVSDGGTAFTLGTPYTYDPAEPWFHVALVFDGGSVTLYRDAVAVDTTGGALVGYENTLFVVGADNDFGNGFDDFFRGELDDLRVYSRALDESEIGALIAAAG